MYNVPTTLEMYLPETNLFLVSESLYPVLISSKSTPDKVVPSQLNCAAIIPAFPGPFDNWNRPLRDPTPPPSEC